MKKCLLLSAFLLTCLPVLLQAQQDTAFLRKTYDYLKEIKSASYYWTQTSNMAYDTVSKLEYSVFKKEFDNPEDKWVGACIASFQREDTSKLVYFYDGKVQSYPDWDYRTIPVDSFQNNRYPFRKVYPPFFTQVKSLLKYAMETSDSIDIKIENDAGVDRILMIIRDKLPEVVGNRIVYARPSDSTEKQVARYEIRFNHDARLPYCIIKRFPDRVCQETCKITDINWSKSIPFDASKYFPPDFKVMQPENEANEIQKLVGEPAPDWKLKDSNLKEVTLSGQKSNVLVLEFTGIGCGPCHQAIPELLKLTTQYNKEDFGITAIDIIQTQPSVIKKYVDKNGIPFPYLIGSTKVKIAYGIRGIPVFVILDENRVIRKIINGFDKETTYSEIKSITDQLLIK